MFDVRGKAAWGAAAYGFEPGLTERTFQGVIIPLNQENAFRQVCETAGPVDTSAESLRRYRNLLNKLKPSAEAPILLLPVRSGGTVSAIFYVDGGGKSDALPVNALEILSEFAGAQLDRLIALSGGIPSEDANAEAERPAPSLDTAPETATVMSDERSTIVEPGTGEPASEALREETAQGESAVESPYPPVEVVPAVELSGPAAESGIDALGPGEAREESTAAAPVIDSDPTPVEAVAPSEETAPASGSEPASVEEKAIAVPPEAGTAAARVDTADLGEAGQKLHRDARRFAKLLVSEIELYNKTKVADGRKNKDLYRLLKADIEPQPPNL